MLLLLIACTILFAVGPGCCGQPAGGDSSSSSAPSTQSNPKGKLDSLTSDRMAEKGKKAGFEVREEVTERTELLGVTIHRLTLDHSKKGTAFVDLYDLSKVSAHASRPAVKIGPNKSLYVSVSGNGVRSEDLLTVLLAKSPLQSMKRSVIEEYFNANGWTPGNSSRVKDDISGHQIVDVSADKGNANALVVLLDYARVQAGKEHSVMARDGDRLLFVDMVERRWSNSLMKLFVN